MNAPSADTSSPFEVVSTFSGCGGSSLGYKLAGGHVRLAVEWDDNAVECYRLNFPSTNIYHGDITKLTAEDALRMADIAPGELDILDGSPPCQGFSTVGERAFDDPRNQLYREYVRMIDVFKPKAFIMENVKGLVIHKMKLIFADMLEDMKVRGYTVSARVLDASWYGVPEHRERVIFVGVRNDIPVDPMLVPYHPAPRSRPVPMSRACRGLPEVTEPPIALNEKMQAMWKHTAKGRTFKYACQALGYSNDLNHYFSSYKVNPNKPCPTITKTVGSHAGLFHWDHCRHLTIDEIKRAHSFPDDFKLTGEFQERWARIGNSVAPLMMKEIASHVNRKLLSREVRA